MDRYSLVRFPVLLAIVMLAGCQHKAPSPVVAGDCRHIGNFSSESELPRVFARTGSSVVLIGDNMYSCSCGASRMLSGAIEDRQLGGSTEDRQLGGATEARQMAGATEGRQMGGDTEGRQMAGGSEGRQMAGGSESRQMGGDREGRQLDGGSEGRQMSGDSESRQHGGDRENRQMAGNIEGRQMGGDTEGRQHGGDTAAYQCGYLPKCSGYVLTNYIGGEASYYDGAAVHAAVGSCIQ